MRVRVIAICLMALTLSLVVLVSANLEPTVFGFPVSTQNGATSAFNQFTSKGVDIETLNTGMPISWTGLSMGPPEPGKLHLLGFNFGSLNGDAFYGQSSNQALTTTSTNFAQTSENSNLAYPFAGFGTISIPGFGFGL